jgi:NitT/TauT family transport system substrate-binding protein
MFLYWTKVGARRGTMDNLTSKTDRLVSRRRFLGASTLMALGSVVAASRKQIATAAAAESGPFLRTTASATFAASVGTLPMSYAPFSVGQELFWEKEENLRLSVQPIAGSVPVTQAVISGSVDLGGPIPDPVLQSHDKGSTNVLFVYSYLRAPSGSVAVLNDSPIRSIAELRGKKIGAQSLGSGDILTTNAMLSSVGVRKDEVQYIAVGMGAQALAALQAARVDALILFDSEYAAMENMGVKLRYFITPEAARLFSTTVTTTTDVVKGKPDVIKAFGRGLAKATVFSLANPEAAVSIHWKRYPASRPTGTDESKALADALNILKKRLQLVTFQPSDSTRKWGYFPEDSIEAWINFAAQYGITSKKIEKEALYTNQFVDSFNEFNEDRVKEVARNYR